MQYVIISSFKDSLDDEYLYWSNEEGWGSRETATIFTQEERDSLPLPLEAGGWVEVSS